MSEVEKIQTEMTECLTRYSQAVEKLEKLVGVKVKDKPSDGALSNFCVKILPNIGVSKACSYRIVDEDNVVWIIPKSLFSSPSIALEDALRVVKRLGLSFTIVDKTSL